MQPLSRLATLALLLVLAVMVVAAPSAVARPLYGVQIDSIDPTDTAAKITAELDAAAALHSKIIRVEVDWSLVEPHVPGQYDPVVLAQVDRVVEGAAQRGIGVTLFVDRTPCWASSSPSRRDCDRAGANTFNVTRYGPSDPQTYVPVATMLAARYGPKLTAFEIWNEPDQANEKYWAGPDKVNRYVALLKTVYGPLKVVNPQLQVLAGSFVGTNGAWLKAMYAAGAQGSYDGLAVHFYDLPLYALANTHIVQLQNHDATPLWLTEYGWTSCYRRGQRSPSVDHPCVSADTQARSLVDVMRAVRKRSWIRAAVIYTLSDQTQAYQFGLLTTRGRRKPSFTAVRKALSRPLTSPRKVRFGLRASRGQMVASGTGSLADLYFVQVYHGSTLRYQAYLRTSRTGRFTLRLPGVLGTSGLRVRMSSVWSGAAVARRH